jgi:DNA-binding transcriptional LysR family regulator
MKIEDIKAFVAVVKKQSLSQAADMLYITQPAITRRIQNLESTLGVELLDRNSRPHKPTPVGRIVFEQCQIVLREFEQLKKMTENTDPTGTLRLGVTQVIGDYVLVDALKELASLYPNVSAKLSTDWSTRLIAKLADGELDAATVLMSATASFPPHIEAHSLMSLEMVLVGARTRYGDQPYQLRELNEQGWILNPEGCGFRSRLQNVLQTMGLPILVNLDTFGTELQLGLVANGVGIGMVPRPLLMASRHVDAIRCLTVSDFSLFVDLWLLHLQGVGNLYAPIQHFAQSISKGFQSYGLPR